MPVVVSMQVGLIDPLQRCFYNIAAAFRNCLPFGNAKVLGYAYDARKGNLRLAENAMLLGITACGGEQDKGLRLVPSWYI